MLPSRYFIDLTQPEIAAQLKKNPLVILPQGSVEQHGPHLPTGTDIFASSVIAHAVRVVGRGGMGVVLHGYDPCLQRDIAVKVLDPMLAGNETARARFCREARSA